MIAELVKTFRFEAAHRLPNIPEDHKCRHMHGHSYRVDIHITGEVDPREGWVMDFGDVKSVVAPVIDELDHRVLNDIDGLENCTSELIAAYLWKRVKPALPALSAVTIWESESSRCIYRGE
ncbi:MAG: 6-carboxytetrahydropterin synthase QueD [Planctomycetota bacterium]